MNFHFSISDNTLESFETSILNGKYHFKDKNLLRRALRGFIFIYTDDEGRKVLAMVGDATLRQILVNQGQERNMSVGKDHTSDNLLHALTIINRQHPKRDYACRIKQSFARARNRYWPRPFHTEVSWSAGSACRKNRHGYNH